MFNQVVMMLKKAFKKIPNNTNLTLHSDQGWQYQMKQYQYLLKEKGINTKYVQKRKLFRQCYYRKLLWNTKIRIVLLKKLQVIRGIKTRN